MYAASILLSGLKIIGLILSALILFLLIVILLILFVPLRYEIYAKYEEEKLTARADISFLLRFIRAGFKYEEDIFYSVKIGFITLFSSDKPKKAVQQKTTVTPENDEKLKNMTAQAVSDKAEVISEKAGQTEQNEVEIKEKAPAAEDTVKPQEEEIKKPKRNIFERLRQKHDAVKRKISVILESIRSIAVKKDAAIKFLNEEGTVEGAKFLMGQSFKLLKNILPKKIEGRLRFGTGDVYTEGQYLSYLCLIYPLIGEKLVIIPEWEEEIIEGDIRLSGRIRIFTLLIILLKAVFSNSTKQLKRNLERCRKSL